MGEEMAFKEKLSSTVDYKNYLRMDADTFNELLQMLVPVISENDTIMRESISAKSRLLATVRYLESGVSLAAAKISNCDCSPNTWKSNN